MIQKVGMNKHASDFESYFSQPRIMTSLRVGIFLSLAMIFVFSWLLYSLKIAIKSVPIVEAANCSGSYRTGVTALTDLGTGSYQGYQGGLYPLGSNVMPSQHKNAGVSFAEQIGPLDANGVPSSSGKYVLLAIGMSNTGAEFNSFIQTAKADPSTNSKLVFINAAHSGGVAEDWADPNSGSWTNVTNQLSKKGVTAQQVVAVWVKMANREPRNGWPKEAEILETNLGAIVRNLKAKLPNVKVVYLSSRIYAGYATTTKNPEPYAYESSFAVKWLIESQVNQINSLGSNSIAGDLDYNSAVSPWLAWGPYLWANGLGPDGVVGGIGGRNDGLEWVCSDFGTDGTHPGPTAKTKVANMLLNFLKTDPTSCSWFTKNESCPSI